MKNRKRYRIWIGLLLIWMVNSIETMTVMSMSRYDTEVTDIFVLDPLKAGKDEDETSSTVIDIFQRVYANEENSRTVESSDEHKLIAPGTGRDYVFRLQNPCDTALDYELELDAYITPDDYQLPIKVRLSRYDGKWLTGDRNIWGNVQMLDTAADAGIIGGEKCVDYVLEWEWLFEEDDKRDTILGNLAVDEEISLTVVIHTRAESQYIEGTRADDSDVGDVIGIVVPQTGDENVSIVWIMTAACAVGILCMSKDYFRFILP